MDSQTEISFGVIGEGITDYIVIKNILLGIFSNEDHEPTVRCIQPPLDETSRKALPEPGGWSLVLRWLASGHYRDALRFNDYLIVQIDTDVSEQKGFDVPWRDGGRNLSVEELVARVEERLVSLIDDDFYAEHQHRFIFAVAVHEIECWLLPLMFTDNKAGKIAGCIEAINRELQKHNRARLKNGENKNPRAYKDLSREYMRQKTLGEAYARNPSFALFVVKLQATRGPNPQGSLPPAPSPG